MEKFRKVITTTTLTIGMLIFASAVFLRVEIWARCKEAEVTAVSAELEWGNHLYKRTLTDLVHENTFGDLNR